MAATWPSSFTTVPTQAPSGNFPVVGLTNSECGQLMSGVKWDDDAVLDHDEHGFVVAHFDFGWGHFLVKSDNLSR